MKFRVEHTIDKKKRQFHNFSMRFGGQAGEGHETSACVGGSGNLTEQLLRKRNITKIGKFRSSCGRFCFKQASGALGVKFEINL